MPKCAVSSLCLIVFALSSAIAQTGSAAGAAAGAALAGSALQSGTASANNAASSGGGASQTPIEVQIMVYGGLKQIAHHIAYRTSVRLKISKTTDAKTLDTTESPWQCENDTKRSVLLQDSTSSAQIALYATFDAYQQALLKEYDTLIALLSKQHDEDAKKKQQELNDLHKQIEDLQGKVNQLQNQLHQQPKNAPKISADEINRFASMVASTKVANDQLIALTQNLQDATGTGGGQTTGGGSSSQPPSMQYLSGIGGELTAAKSNMGYTSSSVQALNQALTTELAKDLCQRGIQLRTATSTLNVADAAADVAAKWEALEDRSGTLSRLISWLQKPATPAGGAESSNGGAGDAKKPPTSDQLIVASDGVVLGSSLATALTAFQNWLGSGDQMGGIILTDVIKGKQLALDFKGTKYPALQVTIDAAGGNTRTNSFPLLNLFYLPKPSFNAGVVVTFELRSENNDFMAGDTLKALYGYSKWEPNDFCMEENVNTVDLDTGRPLNAGNGKCRNVSESDVR